MKIELLTLLLAVGLAGCGSTRPPSPQPLAATPSDPEPDPKPVPAAVVRASSADAKRDPVVAKEKPSRAKITSDSTYYDRKEGFAYFSGHVRVDDSQYLLHADRAYVFMSVSNDLQRIVALGNVAITNGTKRAYGAKASYFRNPGMVVLSGGDGVPAEVRDETPGGNQVVRGKKIKFWTGAEQVEVVEAELSAPVSGAGGLGGVGSLVGGR